MKSSWFLHQLTASKRTWSKRNILFSFLTCVAAWWWYNKSAFIRCFYTKTYHENLPICDTSAHLWTFLACFLHSCLTHQPISGRLTRQRGLMSSAQLMSPSFRFHSGSPSLLRPSKKCGFRSQDSHSCRRHEIYRSWYKTHCRTSPYSQTYLTQHCCSTPLYCWSPGRPWSFCIVFAFLLPSDSPTPSPNARAAHAFFRSTKVTALLAKADNQWHTLHPN